MVAEEGLDEDWAALTEALLGVVESEFPGQVNPVGYGQWRDKGRIGRTFGIMAGGPFPDKIETIIEVPGADLQPIDIANTLLQTMDLGGDWEWGMKGIFALDLGPDLAILGVTGSAMETRAFRIVGKGNQREREDLQCAGIDHSPAFPLNLAIQRVGDEIHVTLVDEMFRMKMYFEDAGKVAFAKNMGMPGSIESEIRDKVELIVSNMR
jgi:hypothetical protein